MLAAPVVAVAGLLLLPLWPVAIVIVGLVRLILIPVTWLATRSGMQWGAGLSGRMQIAFDLVLKPWTYFEPPDDTAAPPAGT